MTNTHIEITITAPIPADGDEMVLDALVGTREPAHAIVELLTKLGFKDVSQRRRAYVHEPVHQPVKRGRKAVEPAIKPVEPIAQTAPREPHKPKAA